MIVFAASVDHLPHRRAVSCNRARPSRKMSSRPRPASARSVDIVSLASGQSLQAASNVMGVSWASVIGRPEMPRPLSRGLRPAVGICTGRATSRCSFATPRGSAEGRKQSSAARSATRRRRYSGYARRPLHGSLCSGGNHLYRLFIGSPFSRRSGLVSIVVCSGSGNSGGFSCRQIHKHSALLD